MKRYFFLLSVLLFFVIFSMVLPAKGFSNDYLYETSLTIEDTSLYDVSEIDASVSISNKGIVELWIKNLIDSDTEATISVAAVLVIEAEVNDSGKTYEFPFDILNGEAHEEFDLELLENDKIEIFDVSVVAASTQPTPTPTATPTATPVSSPTAIVVPTPTAGPTPTASPTPNSISQVDGLGVIILVPGGIISEISQFDVDVTIKPETINLKSNGKFKATISFDSSYSAEDAVLETIECEGAKAIDGKIDGKGRLKVRFYVQDLVFNGNSDLRKNDKDNGKGKDKFDKVELTVKGEFFDGNTFEGSDEVKIKGFDDNDNDEDIDDNDGDEL